MSRLSPAEEVAFLRELGEDPVSAAAFEVLRRAFDTLQARAQLLLSLIALCLTITGFSGPRMAASGALARWSMALGIAAALLSALLLLLGPLGLRWVTATRSGTIDADLARLIRERDRRTGLYRGALWVLCLGLSAYVVAVVAFLLGGGDGAL